MSRRARKKAATRAAIIEAARSLFAERGYAATRTRDIADAAGIATGTLFNYASTKEDIVLMVWKARAEKLAEEGLQSAMVCADPVEGLVALFGPIFDFYAEDLELGRVFLQQAVYASSDDPEMARLNEGFVAQIALLLASEAGERSFFAATSVFSAYYFVLTAMLAGRTEPAGARIFFRELVEHQRQGWRG